MKEKIFRAHKTERFEVFQFYIPHELDFDKVVEMFKFNGIMVDDLCTTTTQGRVVNLWIRASDLDTTTIDTKVGSFL